jgi:hypothetical protein
MLAPFVSVLYFVCTCFNLQKFCPSVPAKHQWFNNMLASNFCKICMRLAANCSVFIIQLPASRMQISFRRPPAGFKFHSVSHQPNANCIRLAAMQYKINKYINSLHMAGNQPNEICIWPAASQMQILQK